MKAVKTVDNQHTARQLVLTTFRAGIFNVKLINGHRMIKCFVFAQRDLEATEALGVYLA